MPYATGSIERAWTDAPASGLVPVPLEDQGVADLSGHEPVEPPDPYAGMWSFFAGTPRRAFKFDGIAWGAGVGVDPDDHSACLTSNAAAIGAYDPVGRARC